MIVSHWYKVSENCLKVSEKSGESEGIFNFLMSGRTILKRLCDGCLVLYFVNFVNDSVLYAVNVNVSEKLLDVNDKKKTTININHSCLKNVPPKQEFTSNFNNDKKEIWKTLV